MYGISSSSCAAQSLSSQASRTLASTGAPAIIGMRSTSAWFTAVPMAPDELSTCSIAGERRSIKETAPSAASTGSFRATFLISACACLMRPIAGCDLHPNAWRRNRGLNSHLYAPALSVSLIAATLAFAREAPFARQRASTAGCALRMRRRA